MTKPIRYCGCGCGDILTGHGARKYVDNSHRMRLLRKRQSELVSRTISGSRVAGDSEGTFRATFVPELVAAKGHQPVTLSLAEEWEEILDRMRQLLKLPGGPAAHERGLDRAFYLPGWITGERGWSQDNMNSVYRETKRDPEVRRTIRRSATIAAV